MSENQAVLNIDFAIEGISKNQLDELLKDELVLDAVMELAEELEQRLERSKQPPDIEEVSMVSFGVSDPPDYDQAGKEQVKRFSMPVACLCYFDTETLTSLAYTMFDKIQQVQDWDSDFGEFYEAIKAETTRRRQKLGTLEWSYQDESLESLEKLFRLGDTAETNLPSQKAVLVNEDEIPY